MGSLAQAMGSQRGKPAGPSPRPYCRRGPMALDAPLPGPRAEKQSAGNHSPRLACSMLTSSKSRSHCQCDEALRPSSLKRSLALFQASWRINLSQLGALLLW